MNDFMPEGFTKFFPEINFNQNLNLKQLKSRAKIRNTKISDSFQLYIYIYAIPNPPPPPQKKKDNVQPNPTHHLATPNLLPRHGREVASPARRSLAMALKEWRSAQLLRTEVGSEPTRDGWQNGRPTLR